MLWAEYQPFARRVLSGIELAVWFVNEIHERLHLGQPREAVLVAWDSTTVGHNVLLGRQPGAKEEQPGAKEDTMYCADFLRDLKG